MRGNVTTWLTEIHGTLYGQCGPLRDWVLAILWLDERALYIKIIVQGECCHYRYFLVRSGDRDESVWIGWG
jgi:hypothetical protein